MTECSKLLNVEFLVPAVNGYKNFVEVQAKLNPMRTGGGSVICLA